MFYIVIASIFLYVEWYFDIQKDFCIVLRFSELILYLVVRFNESSFVLKNMSATYFSAENWPGTGFRRPQTYRCRRFSRTAF